MLSINNLTKSFGKHEVLKDLNLEIREGSIFGLVGMNGAGKSTLLRTIAGVYEPDGGSVLFNERNTYLDPSTRKDIAFVSDETYFPIGSTIASMKTMYECMYDFDEQAYQKYKKMFDLDDEMQINTLSKGNKRRVSLLLALSIHPKLLLLDEAYDGLEPLARLNFKKALTGLLVDENVSVIISSHNLRELEDICDSYGILDDGKIRNTGDLEEARENISRYQLAFASDVTREDFSDFDILRYDQEGRVVRLVIRGDRQQTEEKLNQMQPLLLDVLSASFEELFIYELESRGADNE